MAKKKNNEEQDLGFILDNENFRPVTRTTPMRYYSADPSVPGKERVFLRSSQEAKHYTAEAMQEYQEAKRIQRARSNLLTKYAKATNDLGVAVQRYRAAQQAASPHSYSHGVVISDGGVKAIQAQVLEVLEAIKKFQEEHSDLDQLV